MEFIYGGLAGVMAGLITNPLDVVKTRLQLQGELKARNQHATYYKNTLHAFYIIGKKEGLISLQKGLVPALYFQVCLNGIRLGAIDLLCKYGWTTKSNEKVSVPKMSALAALFGAVGSFVGSPFYLVKTHRQSRANSEIAVGYQHNHPKLFPALINIYKNEGIRGLWRGSTSSLPRIAVGSAVQLSSFSVIKEFLETHHLLTPEKSLWNTFVASMSCGGVVAFFMTPFDLIQTRMYNQGVDKNGKGLLYSSTLDCAIKTFKIEGFIGLFKGFGPCYLRIGPHSLLTLLFWDSLRKFNAS